MSNNQVSINCGEILLNNQNDRDDDHITIRTTSAVGVNDIEVRECNVRVKDGSLKTNKIEPFSGSNIDFDNNTIINTTLGSGITYTDLDTGDIQSTNYSGQTLDAELDTLQSNINAKLSTTGNTGNKFLTTTGAGTIQFSKSISDIVDLNSSQTLTNKSISYSQLTSTPTIPTNNNELTNGEGFITASSSDTLTNKSMSYSQLTGTPTIPDVSSFITASSSDTLTNKSISYSQLTSTPTIPTNNNQLTNGEGFITASSSDTLTNKSISYSQITSTPTIPTNNNQLTNGEGFITASSSDTLTNKSLSYSQLTGTPTIPDVSSFITASSSDTLTNKSISYSQLTGTPTIPTNNNQLTNGEGFITNASNQFTYSNLGSIPSDLITESNTKTLTSKTLTSPVLTTPQINDTSLDNKYILGVSELADNRTITLPLLGANDTFVFKNHTQTLTNKTVDGGSNTITNVPYANLTGTPTIPDVSSFITASSSDTLTNKSISYSQITSTPTIPTNNNQLTNGEGFITNASNQFTYSNLGSIPSDLITESNTKTLSNKTLTSPEIATITNSSATLTLPTSTGTLALTSQLGSGGGLADDDDITFTGSNKFQGDVEIDENNNGKLEFLLNNGALPAQVCTTRLASVQHGNSSATSCTISLPSIKAGQTTDQLVGKDAVQTLTGKSISGSTNTFSNIAYSVLTGTPTIPTNNNQLTNGESYITLSSAGNLTNKSMSVPNNSYLLFLKADTNNTDARIYYDTNDTFKIGNLLVDWISVTDGNAISFSSVPQVSSVNLVTRTSTDTLTNKSISYDQLTGTPTITNYATASTNYTGNNSFQGSLEINNYTVGGVCNFSIPASTSGINSSRKIDFVNTRTSDGGMFEFKEGTTTTMTLKNNKVGVGTNDPDVEFHIVGNSSSTPFVYFEQPHSGGDFRWFFKNDEFTVQRKSGGSYDDVSMYLNYNGGDVIMPKAQVGTTNDFAILTVEGQSSGSFTGQAYTTGGVGSSSSSTSTLGIYSNGDLGVVGVIRVGSDRRIKENITDVPDNLALEMVKKIPCRYYEYKDKERGTEKTIGFIAQEVKSVFDMAVRLGKDYIPNIQKDITHKEWTKTSNGYMLKTNDIVPIENKKYKFIVSDSDEGKIKKKFIECKNNGFLFEEKYKHIYAYGSEIDDFHTLDKQKLFTLNFSATQELIRKNEALEALVQTLSDRITALENK